MANFNLNDYETVEERLRRLYADHPDARIITVNLTTEADRNALTWVIRAELYLIDDDGLPFLKSTGHAFEIDGVNGMANKTSALENCETSAIGRCLANGGYSGNKRASREEMTKVETGRTPSRDWIADASAAKSRADLRSVFAAARKANASEPILNQITAMADGLPE
jgi:hypothetical protein